MAKLNILIITLYLCLTSNNVWADKQPSIQLATKFNLQHNIKHYWISEKLDGVRGYWNGKTLITKNGNPLNPPSWFTQNWPEVQLDGELWIARHSFEQTLSCVKQKQATACWKDIKFMVFDLLSNKQDFTHRIKQIQDHVIQVNSPYFKAVNQFKLLTREALNQKLREIVRQKGEGLMLHYERGLYAEGRSQNIMKLKLYQDAEAKVIKHFEGKGKFKNMLGAIQVKTPDGIIFKIGSGFSYQERQKPPPIGSVITFKYHGKTQKGVPKFASFLRIRGKE